MPIDSDRRAFLTLGILTIGTTITNNEKNQRLKYGRFTNLFTIFFKIEAKIQRADSNSSHANMYRAIKYFIVLAIFIHQLLKCGKCISHFINFY